MFTKNEKITLLQIAREAIISKLENREMILPNMEPPGLYKKNGAFVTLHKHGMLRGCIGNFMPDQPLHALITEMARAAAFNDPRFPPVSKEEMQDIDIEISVLSPLEPCRDINDIKVGTHGIYIIQGIFRGVLLPQVATEHGWTRETFLDQTCIKAGLQPGCWRNPSTEILIFSAEIFGELSEGPVQ